jgi:hypothetical protein
MSDPEQMREPEGVTVDGMHFSVESLRLWAEILRWIAATKQLSGSDELFILMRSKGGYLHLVGANIDRDGLPWPQDSPGKQGRTSDYIG